MKIIQEIKKEDSVIPITPKKQDNLKGGRIRQKFISDKENSQSSPPRWKDE